MRILLSSHKIWFLMTGSSWELEVWSLCECGGLPWISFVLQLMKTIDEGNSNNLKKYYYKLKWKPITWTTQADLDGAIVMGWWLSRYPKLLSSSGGALRWRRSCSWCCDCRCFPTKRQLSDCYKSLSCLYDLLRAELWFASIASTEHLQFGLL